jgi:hypothetical protein
MAKPDIQRSFITASGTLFRDKGKLGLEDKGPVTGLALAALDFANDGAAATGGVAIGELYHTSGDVQIRLV